MNRQDDDTSVGEKLVQGYKRMMERAQALIEDTSEQGISDLQKGIERAAKTAVEMGELSREEAERIGSYLKRDMEDAGHYLAETGHELGDWLRVDLEAIEDRLLDLFARVADQTKLQWLDLERQLRDGPDYHTGEVTGPGTLLCCGCGQDLQFTKVTHIPPCPKCHHTIFRRPMTED